MRGAGDGPYSVRLRDLIVILWRSGLRIAIGNHRAVKRAEVLGGSPAWRWSQSQSDDQVADLGGLGEEWVVAGVEAQERRWAHATAHYELTVDALPSPEARWAELIFFCGAHDGYAVIPNRDACQAYPRDAAGVYTASGELPEGLTMLRAALFGQARGAKFGDEPQDDPVRMRFLHACVERIRELVATGAHQRPDATSPAGVRDKVSNAYERLLRAYARWGGYGYHGWTDFPDVQNYWGPTVWSGRDCGLRLALALEQEWPEHVHMEFAIGRASRADFDKTVEKAQRVDVAVSDLSTFEENDTSQDRYRAWQHEAFFEVKWMRKGWRGNRFEMDAINSSRPFRSTSRSLPTTKSSDAARWPAWSSSMTRATSAPRTPHTKIGRAASGC